MLQHDEATVGSQIPVDGVVVEERSGFVDTQQGLVVMALIAQNQVGPGGQLSLARFIVGLNAEMVLAYIS